MEDSWQLISGRKGFEHHPIGVGSNQSSFKTVIIEGDSWIWHLQSGEIHQEDQPFLCDSVGLPKITEVKLPTGENVGEMWALDSHAFIIKLRNLPWIILVLLIMKKTKGPFFKESILCCESNRSTPIKKNVPTPLNPISFWTFCWFILGESNIFVMDQMLVTAARLTTLEEDAWWAHVLMLRWHREELCMLKDLSSSCPQAPLWPPLSGLKLDAIWKSFRAMKECYVIWMFFLPISFVRNKLGFILT